MDNKINPVLARSHPEFQDILKKLQNARVKSGKEDIQGRVALWKLTKTIKNLIVANKDVWDSLVEVEINGNQS